jgi:hypothetical protein
LRGTLGDFSFADILQLIGLQRKSGVLILEREGERVEIGLDSGRVVSAESSKRPLEQRLGNLLLRIGRLTESRLAEALAAQKQTLKRLGHVLVDNGWVDQESIRRQLMLQITETVYDLFGWTSGEYDFRPEHEVEWDEQFIEPIPCEHLMMEGARMVDEWPMIQRLIPSPEVVLKPTPEGEQLIATAATPLEAQGSIYDEDIDFELIPSDPLGEAMAGPRLGRMERHVLRWVDGQRTAREIAELTELGRFEACKTLAKLVEARILSPVSGVRAAARSHRVPVFMLAELPARVLTAAVLALAAVGVAATLWQVVLLVRPSLPKGPLPVTATSAPRMAQATGIDEAARLSDLARRTQIDRAQIVSFLHTRRWDGSLDRLVEQDLLSPNVVVDPWGRPYSRGEGESSSRGPAGLEELSKGAGLLTADR